MKMLLCCFFTAISHLSICVSVGLSQQGLTKEMSGLHGPCSASNIAVRSTKELQSMPSLLRKCWKTWQKSLRCGTRVSSFATSLHSNTQEVKLNIKQYIEPYSDTNNCILERLLRLRGSDLSSHKAKREQKERLERNTRQWVVIFSACCM